MSGAEDPPPADDAALESMLRDRRFGPPDPADVTPWDFALRWPDAVVRERVWPVVSRLLVDDDATVRARSVELVRRWSEGRALTSPRLLEVAERHAALYGDQIAEGLTLRSSLAFSLCSCIDTVEAPRLVAVLEEMVTHEAVDGGTASVLGRHAPLFVAERAQAWGDTQAGWIVEAAGSVAFCRLDAILPFLGALRELSRATRERALAAVEEYIARDDELARQRASSFGIAPPCESAPSAASCRSALGL
jgi:hypothetical protein